MRVRKNTFIGFGFGIIAAVLVAVAFDPNWAAIGAVAAAVSAAAAWRAANASARTGRDALLALALAIRPGVEVVVMTESSGHPPGTPTQPIQKFVAKAWNTSHEWEAVDVDVEVRFRNGRTIEGHRERIRPSGGGKYPWMSSDHLDVDLGGEPSPGQPTEQVIEAVLARFSDSRRICRYEWRRNFFFEERLEGTITSTLASSAVEQRQIDGP